MICFREVDSPIGRLTLAGEGHAVVGLWMAGQKYWALPDSAQARPLPVLDEAEGWLGSYFAGENPKVSFSLKPQGTAFRQMVWEELGKIPYGETASYGEIAGRLSQKIGKRVSPRSVGNAVGHNPISILVPCHRVVGADGRLTGYAGGLERKIFLLTLEGALAAGEEGRHAEDQQKG